MNSDYTTCDYNLFQALNFDGGEWMDRIMLTISGTPMWIPLYLLILWLVYRQYGLKSMILFVVLMVGAIALADIVSGIFKHSGMLSGALPGFEPRLRPMFNPALEGMAITADSLETLRRTADTIEWQVHVPVEALGGRFGTVSGHASTTFALVILSAAAIRRRWFTLLMIVAGVLICYSRIYIGKHYPMDLLWGTLLGLALGGAAYGVFRYFTKNKESH